MAENVQRNLENMRPILEHMEKLQLFTGTEIKEITKKWKDYEYKLQRHIKTKTDYLQYIQYQLHLMKLIKHRRQKHGITKQKSNIDFAIGKKIHHLYKNIIYKYQNDTRIWLAYTSFCKKVGFKKAVKKVFGKMLSVQHTKAKIWHIAARWEIEEENDLETAKLLLYRALLYHPDSQLIYIDLLRLELDESLLIDKKLNLEEEYENINNPNYLEMPTKLKSVFELYKQATKKIKDLKFLINFLEIIKKYKGTEILQNVVLSDMMKDYPHEPLMWDTLAKREYEGLLNPSLSTDSKTPSTVKDLKQLALRKRIENCYEVYKVALKKLKSQEMWSLFIDCIIKINQEHLNTLPILKRKFLRNALIQGHQERKLQEKHYLDWIEMLNTSDRPNSSENINNKLYEVLCWGIEAFPKSENLWAATLQYLYTNNQDHLALEIFDKAVKSLEDNSLPLWKLRLRHLQSKYPNDLERFFEEALKTNIQSVNSFIRPAYFEWLVLFKGIDAARKAYDVLSLLLPPCLELHQKAAALEISQINVSLQSTRKIYEVMTLQFGRKNIDVWLEYTMFEIKFGDVRKASNIYQRAIKSLRPTLVTEFIDKFNLMKISPAMLKIFV